MKWAPAASLLLAAASVVANPACSSAGSTSGNQEGGAGNAGGSAGTRAGSGGRSPSAGQGGDAGAPEPLGDAGTAGEGGAGTIDPRACDSEPCVNGTCEPIVNGYRCDCEPDFAGESCELPRFEALGYLPDTTFSVANAMDGAGTLVVGADHAGGVTRPFAWTPADGMALLAPIRGSATGVSADARVVVGYFELNDTAGALRAFRYTAAGGVAALGAPAGAPPETWSQARAVSRAGDVIAGTWRDGNLSRGFRWTAGSMDDLGELVAGMATPCDVWALSGDGNVVVGDCDTPIQRAVRWTASTGLVSIDTRTGVSTQALAVNGDGSVVVGHVRMGADASSPFRWTQSTGVVTLGVPFDCGDSGSRATAISDDGSSIGISCAGSEAFLRDGSGDFHSVRDALGSAGVDLAGWRFDSIVGMSDDGKTIAGTAINPDMEIEGYIARLP